MSELSEHRIELVQQQRAECIHRLWLLKSYKAFASRFKLLSSVGALQHSHVLHIGLASSEEPRALSKSGQATSQCHVHLRGK